ncbi:MAG: hypothetical protein JSV02_00355 [Dehalococcoidia bacterium]|nr:MAG: hypothetical protein JSV02_00355 [Dehalococcoidia bacterium]
MEELTVLNPIGIFKPERVVPATRPKTLNGKRIGLQWNEKPRGDIALLRVKELLEQRFTGVNIEFLPSTNIVRPLTQEQLDEIQEWKPDAVIGGTAD